ncbi:PspC domain-containing protein [Corynebacterium aquilae]|uniref:Phage shock protein PspC N-terminal domain-containing protein n=1 Tax=Corynebacterium aquilae DSM 44791 TaxID=1431546 RepID=A0A1L7CE81_9CORY|nr:PspC domain-containing protein [Corynebacterium aquilae]APT84135.1 hypothetical protein CAQU_02570 [Corynebacterium aquilae DSM 44791]
MTNQLPTPQHRLYRSSTDKYLAGVCGGIAEYFDWDPTVVRLVVAIASLGLNLFSPLIYLVAAVVIPKRPGF